MSATARRRSQNLLTVRQTQLGHFPVTNSVGGDFSKEDEVDGSHGDCWRPILYDTEESVLAQRAV